VDGRTRGAGGDGNGGVWTRPKLVSNPRSAQVSRFRRPTVRSREGSHSTRSATPSAWRESLAPFTRGAVAPNPHSRLTGSVNTEVSKMLPTPGGQPRGPEPRPAAGPAKIALRTGAH